MPDHDLQRLERVFIEPPIFYVTARTHERRPILADPRVTAILVDEWRNARERHGWAVGRYVIMPNHVHFFCSPGAEARSLSDFMQHWKQWTSKRMGRECGIAAPVWQHGFFDHLLRSEESYEQKWLYVCANPVRAGLVASEQEWPWRGEIGSLS